MFEQDQTTPDQRGSRVTGPRKSVFGHKGSLNASLNTGSLRMKKIPVLVKRKDSGAEDFER